MVFDEYGKLYVSQNVSWDKADATDAVVSIEWNTPGTGTGTVTPLYNEILIAPLVDMVWGNSNFLYLYYYVPGHDDADGNVIAAVRKIYRLSMPFNSAPYFGRQ
jgi:hypothetical protein